MTCSYDAVYYSESKKKILLRITEHQQDNDKGKWESSGATEHCLKCHGQFSWLHHSTIKSNQNITKEKQGRHYKLRK